EDRHGPGAHGEDVAKDPADARRGALVRLHRARVVVRFDLERDGEPVTDRDDAGILARPRDDAFAGGRQRPQERLRALVRAVLAPHHAEHRELEVVRVPAEAVANRDELVVGQPERSMEWHHGRERRPGRARGSGRGVAGLGGVALGHDHDPTATGARSATSLTGACAALDAASTSERRIGSPSSEPSSASDARSGCGIRPATLPCALSTPAMARRLPFGFAGSPSALARVPPASTYRNSTW